MIVWGNDGLFPIEEEMDDWYLVIILNLLISLYFFITKFSYGKKNIIKLKSTKCIHSIFWKREKERVDLV